MREIGDWLAELGLERYAQTFADNGIDLSVLSDLTDQDLERLGVLLGHRRKLLREIANLKTDAPRAPAAAAAPNPAAPSPAAPALEAAERRQLTVMFADLVGSTALSMSMDPEDLREIISAYQNCVTATVRRFGGLVADYMGDGVLVYFGHPEAHEDDAAQAVRAGLEVIAAVAALQTRQRLQSRVGIATGLVVVGSLIGSDAPDRAIVGETPNLAARLQASAQPDTLVIAEGTRRLVGNLFELAEIQPGNLKGIAGPLRAFIVQRPSSVASRFEALHGDHLIRLVGRDEEMELLLRRWTTAKAGEGQVAVLSGEAGIGKSRLAVALIERLAGEPHSCLQFLCSPQHTDSVLYPIVAYIERAAGLAHDDAASVRLDKLDAMLARTATAPEHASLLAAMLSLPNDGRYPTLDLTPQQRRERTLAALHSLIEALTRQNPVLMIFEDVHWADPTSLELLGSAVERVASLRALLITTCRPEFEPPWIGQAHVSVRTINRLTRREVDTLIGRFVGDKPIPAGVRQGIVARADGVPLFAEEMTKAALEAEGEDAARRPAAAPAGFTVPASLHATLMARLDRVGPAKEVAQVGAAIGREFSHALLVAVVRQPEAMLGSALDRLTGAGLLFRRGLPPHVTYVFKHALVQDAAYATLLRETRRVLHARIVERLEGEFSEIAESQPELLARHCTEAGLAAKAAMLWGKAGQRSLNRSALVEAAEQLTRALDQIATLPSTPELRRERIKLQVALIIPLIHVKGYAAPETRAAVEQARLLIEQARAMGEPPDDPLMLFSVLFASWAANTSAFQGDVVRALAAEFMALARKQTATAPFMDGHRMIGISCLFTGELVQARDNLDRAVALYEPTQGRPVGLDARVATLVRRSWALWLLGHPDLALADSDDALAAARGIAESPTMLFTLPHALLTHILRGDYAMAQANADELTALADSQAAALWKLRGTALQGCLFALAGQPADAVQAIDAAIAALTSTGTTLWLPLYLSHLAQAHAALGKFDDARRCIAEATSAMTATKETWWQAEATRVAGEIELMAGEGDPAKIEDYFLRALDIARAQHAKSLALRAATSLARLRRGQGRLDSARDVLAAVYGSFTEGFGTLDLKAAKALLETLPP